MLRHQLWTVYPTCLLCLPGHGSIQLGRAGCSWAPVPLRGLFPRTGCPSSSHPRTWPFRAKSGPHGEAGRLQCHRVSTACWAGVPLLLGCECLEGRTPLPPRLSALGLGTCLSLCKGLPNGGGFRLRQVIGGQDWDRVCDVSRMGAPAGGKALGPSREAGQPGWGLEMIPGR